MDDPWRDVQPIGVRPTGAPARAKGREVDTTTRTSEPESGAEDPRGRQPPSPFAGLSSDELWRRRERTRANAGDKTGRGQARGADKNRRWSRHPIKVRELVEMGSALARKCYGLALSEETKPHEAKQHIVGWGVTVDKLNALEGRPTQIVAFTDEVRPATHDLAGKLALMAKRATA